MTQSIKEQVEEIKKEIEKNTDNHALISFGYNSKFVVKLSEALNIIEALKNCETYDTTDYSNPKITNLTKNNNMEVSLLSQEEYVAYKASHILGIPSSEILNEL